VDGDGVFGTARVGQVAGPGVDRNRLHEYIGGTALRFFDFNLGVKRSDSK